MSTADDDTQEDTAQVEEHTIEERLDIINNNLLCKFSVQDGINISKQWRSTLKQRDGMDMGTLSYAETGLKDFVTLLLNLRSYDMSFSQESIFIEIGSGFGKIIIASAVLRMFKKVIGVEIVSPLHRRALELMALFAKNFRNPLEQCDIEFINADGTYFDWSFANLIFIDATNFDHNMMKRIDDTAQKLLVSSAIMIMNNRLLNEKHFELVKIVEMPQSFGTSQLFIYRKMLNGDPPSIVASKKLQEVLAKNYDI